MQLIIIQTGNTAARTSPATAGCDAFTGAPRSGQGLLSEPAPFKAFSEDKQNKPKQSILPFMQNSRCNFLQHPQQDDDVNDDDIDDDDIDDDDCLTGYRMITASANLTMSFPSVCSTGQCLQKPQECLRILKTVQRSGRMAMELSKMNQRTNLVRWRQQACEGNALSSGCRTAL